MKKSLLLSLLLALCISGTAQNWVTIPDANFANRLNFFHPQCMDGNLMNTECPGIVNSTSLNVYNDGISDLTGIEYFVNLQSLSCSNNSLTSLPELPTSLTELLCFNNNLNELPELPTSLTKLLCYQNNLNELPELPTSLTELRCRDNNLTELPELPASLTELRCHNNNLIALPELPASLTELQCDDNNLTSLPELPTTLTHLITGNNNLNSLPNLPESLTHLYCSSNNLTSLPDLPPLLTILMCHNNNITSLPELPTTLAHLTTGNNNLNSLPNLPESLNYLHCVGTNLTHLPDLPASLLDLYCSSNNLTYLPELPPSLEHLVCEYNQISCLPELPMTLTNPNPQYEFNISSNSFTCLPNYVPAMSFDNVQWLAFPLCDMDDLNGNPFGCTSAAGISGTVFSDENLNCIEDSQESQLANIQLHLYNENDSLVSSTSTFGNIVNSHTVYHFTPETGTYTVFLNTENMPFQVSCMDPGNEQEINLTESNLSALNIDFAVDCLPGFDIGVQSVVTSGWVFPGQVHTLNIAAGDMSSWYGLQCAQGVSGTVTIFVEGSVSYVGPANNSLMPTVTGDLQFSYNIADFSMVNFQTDFALLLETDTTAVGGELVCVFVSVTPLGGDLNPENNTKHHCYNVVNSYDPNIKQVWPQNVEPGFDDYFNYTIYFQNTGTAPAFNIRLADTLDTNLDLNTFQVTNYSHPVLTYLHGNVLTFRFNNIMLPDSTTDLEGSIGFVQYRIKPLAGLQAGTVIENTAHIFFDFNDAIVTNTALNEYVIPTAVADITMPELIVFPNPGTGLFNISLKNSSNHQSTLEIYNLSGQRILQQQMNENQAVLDLSTQPAGIYMLRMQNTFGTKTMKLVKQ